MKLTHHLTAACLLLVGSRAAAPPGDAEFLRITPDEVHWADVPNGHGAQMATLLGDPDKPGLLRDGTQGDMACRHRHCLRREAGSADAARQLHGAPGPGSALGRLGHG